jgi:hypothetical protein
MPTLKLALVFAVVTLAATNLAFAQNAKPAGNPTASGIPSSVMDESPQAQDMAAKTRTTKPVMMEPQRPVKRARLR